MWKPLRRLCLVMTWTVALSTATLEVCAQRLPPPALEGLRAAVTRAHDDTIAQMRRDGEVGAGSETTACMEAVTQRRFDAVDRLRAVAAQAVESAPTRCALLAEAFALRETLTDEGVQAFALDGENSSRVYLSRCRVQAVSLPDGLEAWFRDLAARCGQARVPTTQATRCVVAAPAEFHLRPTATADPVGRILPEATPLQVLARGALRRRGWTIFRVRVRGAGWEGWTFLPSTSISPGCP